ncbi:UDP-glycosyltransferase 88F3 [Camellia lanceoleosa]|uniref:UDP-glycosyltransferase 88F3 n=1 Tax=Camellia lanceoleosa TaxID=1840588 RepID=A0ACC0IK21_9ERIC|nr:UDP-glycosyltransferase 88F3 [Camellia lanceoleosa]
MKDTIVLYPAPGMGHVVSMVELGKLILHHYSSKFTINILITTGLFDTPPPTPTSIPSPNPPSISFHRLPPLTTATATAPTISRAAIAFEFIRRNAANVRHSLHQISQTSTIRSLIIDFFCTSALPIATALGIPIFYFFTSGAAALAAYLHFPTIHKQIHNSFRDLSATEIHVPGLPQFELYTCLSLYSTETSRLRHVYSSNWGQTRNVNFGGG